MDDNKKKRCNRLFGCALAISILVLGVSFSAQLAGVKPCLFCNLQRIPYALIAILATIGMFTPLKKAMLKTIQVALVGGVLLSSTHLAIQMGKIETSCECSKTTFDQQEWKVLGLSAPYWNIAVCLGGIVLIHRYKK